MQKHLVLRIAFLSLALLAFSRCASSQLSVSISVGYAPPPIPVYEQPICPADGYLWVPGYWAYDDEDGYYWVPGTWIEPPQVGYLWTPGWWGWGGSAFVFHQGYWGPHVGFYGGINYGFGYSGDGYHGGRWEGNRFAYNTYANHVNTTIIHNTYNTTINNINVTRVSYNGGNGGIAVRPSSQDMAYEHERRVPPVSAQVQHVQQARGNPELRASANQGRPAIAATARPTDFRNAVSATRAGGEWKAPPPGSGGPNHAGNRQAGEAPRQQASEGPRPQPNEAPRQEQPARGAEPASRSKTPSEPTAHGAPPNHANELQPHKFSPPNTGNPSLDQRYQQQQDRLVQRQNQEHQQLQQRQEQQHQQAAARNSNDAKKQQMEQRHGQQTQHMEQRHEQQQQHLEQHQATHQQRQAPHEEKK